MAIPQTRLNFEADAKHVIEAHRRKRGLEDGVLFDEFLSMILVDRLGISSLDKYRQNVTDETAKSAQELVTLYEQAVSNSKWEDLLGPLYTTEIQTNGAKRQNQEYFTPSQISRCMAQMIIHGEEFKDDIVFRFCDPCVGAGSLALGFIEAVEQHHGTKALEKLSVTGIDISYYGTRMFASQVLTNCTIHKTSLCELVALKGDSLTLANIETIAHAQHVKLAQKDSATNMDMGELRHQFAGIAPAYQSAYGDSLTDIINPYAEVSK